MKILTDLGHPKNIHISKNVIPLLEQKGHEIYFVYREREHIKDLCRAFSFFGTSRGAGASGIFGKFIYLLKAVFQLYKLAREINPDLLLSFGSPYLSVLGLLKKKPVIVLDDTEGDPISQAIYARSSAAIVVPGCFQKALGRRLLKFDGYYELAYLSPCYFKSDPAILKELGLTVGEKFVLLRFVSWHAVHDISHNGLSPNEKQELVTAFSGLARVFISADGELPHGLESLRLKTPPELIHQVMAQAALVFGEGATMAAEAAVLGVPSIYCSDLRPGYIADLEKRHGLLSAFPRGGFKEALARGMDILRDKGEYRKGLMKKRDAMLAQSIDVVAFMTWFIDQFPGSVDVMLADPRYARRFK